MSADAEVKPEITECDKKLAKTPMCAKPKAMLRSPTMNDVANAK